MNWVFWGENVVRIFLRFGKVSFTAEIWKFGKHPYRFRKGQFPPNEHHSGAVQKWYPR